MEGRPRHPMVNVPYRFGRFKLNPDTRRLLADGDQVPLGARAFDVLIALVERRERVVTKDELLELVWPGLVVEENNLSVQISALRKALGPHAIATIPGRGYRFTATVEADSAPAPSEPSDAIERQSLGEQAPEGATEVGAMSNHAPARPAVSGGFRLRTRTWVAGTVTIFLILGVGAVLWSKREAPAPGFAGNPEASLIDSKSVAVLPFTNLSEDKGTAYFADGVHEDLLTQLALLGELKVVSRTSVMEYRDTKKNARQIAAELGVGSLLEGSVRRAGNQVRITAQLVDARSDKHLWAKSYDRELTDIFAIQSELATEIARALKVSLTPRDRAQLGRRPTENLEAYELFLRHRQLDIQTVTLGTDRTFEQRIDLLSRAVKLDPKFALGWAKLGVDEARVRFFYGDPSNARLDRARSAIDRALSLAPDDMEVRLQLGYLYHYGYQDFGRAARYVEDLLKLAPNHVEMLAQLSYLRLRQGRWADANALLEKALSIDARNVNAAVQLRQNLLYFRHFDEALSLQRRIIELSPGNLEQEALLYLIERFKTGSFASYDAWRNALTAAEARKFEMVWSNDLFRALDNRDLETALRLLESPPKQGEAAVAGWFVDSSRAFVLLALGRRAQAIKFARSKLPEARETLRRTPDDRNLQYDVLMYLAILGERSAALTEFQRWRDSSRVRSDAYLAQDVMAWEAHIFAALGDRERALRVIARVAKEPNAWWEYTRIDPPLASLWDDPGFLAIVNDPANNAPLRIENRGIPRLAD